MSGSRWEQLFDGHVCSLGYQVIDWIEEFECHGPGDVAGSPIEYDKEIRDFIIECYRLDPVTGRRVYSEAVLSRPKGRAKSEVAGHIVVAEALADCVRFDGWGADGQPKGRGIVNPLIKCLASEEYQAGNTFENVAYVCGEWGKDNFPELYGGISGMKVYQSATNLYLPLTLNGHTKGGDIRATSSGAASKDGGKETFVVPDESHLYVTRELKAMYATIARNLGSKRKQSEPWMMQTSTAPRQGEQSVFEETLMAWRKGDLPATTYFDHKEAKGPIKIRDKDHTMKQLVEVFGEASQWQDMDRKYADMIDPRICPDDATAARYYLNRMVASKDAWIPKDVHDRQVRPKEHGEPEPQRWVIQPGEAISLGFDGSLNEDSTVLRGCRMSDGFLFKIAAWEKPKDVAAAIGWEVPRLEVIQVWHDTFDRYNVVRMYADPHEWRTDIDTLAERFRIKLPKGKFEDRVVAWSTHRDTAMAFALDRLHADLVNGVAFHDDDPVASDHYGNAYVRHHGKLRLVRKEYPNSPRKIDSVVADALAYEARADAIADGWDQPRGGLTRVKGKARSY